MPEKTTADAMIDLLVDQWGVRHVFGIPGDGCDGLVESLRKRREDVQFIQVRHEEAAAFAAVGYAKFSERLGVCLATSGPGAIHLMNGLYDAKLDGVPVLAITGMQYHDLIGTRYQQDVPNDRIMADVAVFSERVMGPAHVENVTNMAVRSALSRRGVAHLCIPNDTQELPTAAAKFSPMDRPHHTSADWRPPRVVPTDADLAAAAEVLNAGTRVAVVVGSGARGARAELEQLADTLGAPVAKALLGKDVFPDDSPFCTGSMGVLGTKPTQSALANADTLLMVGSSFPYVSYLPKPGQARGVQIDLDASRIGLRLPVQVGLVGDARETLRALLPKLRRREDRSFLEGIQREIQAWWRLVEEQASSDAMPMKPQRVAWELGRQMRDDAILCGDSGTSTVWAARDVLMRGDRRFSCSGTLASMASALPYAIGAQVAFPERQVVAFAGDGGFTMLMGEVATCVKYGLPVKVVIIKNNALGMIRWEQMLYLGNPEYGVELQEIDFAQIAGACGATGTSVSQPAELASAIAQLLQSQGPAVLEAVVDPFEPLIPPTVKPEQAEHFAEALKKGEPNKERIGLSLNRELAMEREAVSDAGAGALADKAGGELGQATDEGVKEAFGTQKATAAERPSEQ